MTAHTDREPLPLKVHVTGISEEAAGALPIRPRRGYTAHYETFQLTANDPVCCILPADPDRVEAFVITLDNDIVLGTKNQVQSAQNTASGAPAPIGTYLPAKTTGGALFPFPVKDCEAIWAGVTTTASNSRVSVAAYYRSSS